MIKCHLNFFLSHPSNSPIFFKLCHINFGTKKISTSLILLSFSRQMWTEVKANQIIVCCTAEFVQMIFSDAFETAGRVYVVNLWDQWCQSPSQSNDPMGQLVNRNDIFDVVWDIGHDWSWLWVTFEQKWWKVGQFLVKMAKTRVNWF